MRLSHTCMHASQAKKVTMPTAGNCGNAQLQLALKVQSLYHTLKHYLAKMRKNLISVKFIALKKLKQ